MTGKQVDAESVMAAELTVTFDPAQTSVTAVTRAVTEAGFPAKARAGGG